VIESWALNFCKSRQDKARVAAGAWSIAFIQGHIQLISVASIKPSIFRITLPPWQQCYSASRSRYRRQPILLCSTTVPQQCGNVRPSGLLGEKPMRRRDFLTPVVR
jgi:hypothetical protein